MVQNSKINDIANSIFRRISSFWWNLSTVVKLLLILNISIFIIQFIGGNILHISFFVTKFKTLDNKTVAEYSEFFKIFSLYIPYLKKYFLVSQFLTSLFIHSGFLHLFFNMLLLGSGGPFVERQIGSLPFLKLYLLSGIFAGFCQLIFSLIGPGSMAGSSCSVCAIWATFAFMNPDIKLMIIPGVEKSIVSAKMLILFYAGLTLVMAILGSNTVTNLAILGGMLFGYLYVKDFKGLKRLID